MYRIDLHTHSVGSPDGALRLAHYRRMLERGRLDVVAITDHNTIAFALEARQALGERMVVGEEVSTAQGELIGLYLQTVVSPGRSALATARAIHAQGGLVYVPHPFETVRRGLAAAVLDEIADEVDIIETYNGRAWAQDRSVQAQQWALKYGVAAVASSDAHGALGWGRTYSMVDELPDSGTLVDLLRDSQQLRGGVGALGLLYPKVNRWRRQWKRS